MDGRAWLDDVIGLFRSTQQKCERAAAQISDADFFDASYHAGQIVHLARELAGESWQSFSVPLGESEQLNARMRAKFGDWSTRGV